MIKGDIEIVVFVNESCQNVRVAENRVARQRRCYEENAASTKKELPPHYVVNLLFYGICLLSEYFNPHPQSLIPSHLFVVLFHFSRTEGKTFIQIFHILWFSGKCQYEVLAHFSALIRSFRFSASQQNVYILYLIWALITPASLTPVSSYAEYKKVYIYIYYSIFPLLRTSIYY